MNFISNTWYSLKRKLFSSDPIIDEQRAPIPAAKRPRSSFGSVAPSPSGDTFTRSQVEHANRNQGVFSTMNTLINHAGQNKSSAAAVAANEFGITPRHAARVFAQVADTGETLRKDRSGRPSSITP